MSTSLIPHRLMSIIRYFQAMVNSLVVVMDSLIDVDIIDRILRVHPMNTALLRFVLQLTYLLKIITLLMRDDDGKDF